MIFPVFFFLKEKGKKKKSIEIRNWNSYKNKSDFIFKSYLPAPVGISFNNNLTLNVSLTWLLFVT